VACLKMGVTPFQESTRDSAEKLKEIGSAEKDNEEEDMHLLQAT